MYFTWYPQRGSLTRPPCVALQWVNSNYSGRISPEVLSRNSFAYRNPRAASGYILWTYPINLLLFNSAPAIVASKKWPRPHAPRGDAASHPTYYDITSDVTARVQRSRDIVPRIPPLSRCDQGQGHWSKRGCWHTTTTCFWHAGRCRI